MCRRIECGECGRPGFAGCGKHIEQVLGSVPTEKRCRCREARADAVNVVATRTVPHP